MRRVPEYHYLHISTFTKLMACSFPKKPSVMNPKKRRLLA